MDIYGWDSTESALHAYVGAIVDAFDTRPEYTCSASTTPASAYVALDDRLPDFPDRDLALVWDEKQGWAAAIETHSGEDLIIVSYLGGQDPVPEPRRVVRFVEKLLAGAMPGQLEPPSFPSSPDLPRKLFAAARAASTPSARTRVTASTAARVL
ncbi:DUF6292 family protein [Prauserella oleivorans]|uniref:DUF6292 family protein n=1 Tax=Prauserella oleivorans TaxID=1478153 RepID=A0ABW5WBF1_9PSEU